MEFTINLPEWVLFIQNIPIWGWCVVWYVITAIIVRLTPYKHYDDGSGEKEFIRFFVWLLSPIIFPLFLIVWFLNPGLFKDE